MTAGPVDMVVRGSGERSDRRELPKTLAPGDVVTATNTGRLMIAVLGGLADVERDLICTRTAEGRRRYRKRGQHMGRAVTIDRPSEGPKHGGGGRKVRRLPNSPAATT